MSRKTRLNAAIENLNTEKLKIMYTNLQFLWGEVPAGNWLWCRVTGPGITLKMMENKETKVNEVKNTKTRETYNKSYNVKVIYLRRTGSAPPLGWAGLVLCLAQRAHMRGQRLT